MGTFAYYSDAGLTVPLVSLATALLEAGSTDVQVWYGSLADAGTKKIQDNANPGITTLAHSPYDPNAGTGQPVGALKLAETQLGLDGAIAGAPYDTGEVTQLSGLENAVSFWVRVTDITHLDDDTLQIKHNTVIESNV